MRWVRVVVLTVLLVGNLLPVPGPSPALLAAVAAVPLVGFEVLRALWVEHRIHPAVWFVLPLFAVLSLSGFRHVAAFPYATTALHNFTTITLLSALAACLLRDADDLPRFAQVWTAVGVLLAAGALTGQQVNGRAVGLDEANPIWLARMLATAIVAVAWLYWTGRLRGRWTVLLVVELAAGLLATGSRGPLTAMVVAVLAVAATQSQHRGRRLTVLLGAVVAVTLAAASGLLGSGRVTGFLADAGGSLSTSSRTKYWSDTIDLIKARPAGVGVGNWGYYTAHAPAAYWPHDLTLEVFAESGVIVGVLFLLVVLVVFVRLVRYARRDPQASLVLGLLACESVSVSVSGDVNARTFFMLLTLGWLVGRGVPDRAPAVAARVATVPRVRERPTRHPSPYPVSAVEDLSPEWERALGVR